MIKLIIFDLDGTLLYTLEDLANSCNFVLEKYGQKTHSIADYKYLVGSGMKMLLQKAFGENFPSQYSQNILDDFLQHYAVHQYDTTRPYAEIPMVLHILQEQNKMLAVASNKMDNATKVLITKYFPNINFNIVAGATENMPTKPNPDIVNNIMDYCGVTSAETLYIGDSNIDMETAKNASIKSIGALWGYRTKKELTEAGADFLALSPVDIIEIVANNK